MNNGFFQVSVTVMFGTNSLVHCVKLNITKRQQTRKWAKSKLAVFLT